MIARTLGISRNTVRVAVASEGPPKYERKPAGSAVDAFEDAIRAQLKDVPTMPATVIAERVGWTRGMTVFKERVRELRPAYLPPDPAGRTTYEEHKGIIERAHDYLERSFLPGRTFTGPGDFNHQLQQWLVLVNARTRRVLGCAPTARISADRQAMLTVPPVAPATGWRSATRLARDHYIRLDSNDYSVHPAVIGRRIEVTADLDRVRVFCDGKVVADHERVWAWHQTITDPEHGEAAEMLRRNRIGALRPVHGSEDRMTVEQRALSDYDTALGIDLGEGAERVDGRHGPISLVGGQCPL